MADGAEDPLFHDVWTFYVHAPDDVDWTLGSYVRLGDAASVSDFWSVHAAVRRYLHRGMFFVMREHVFPCWDDKYNQRGGCLSIKVPRDEVLACWEHLVTHLMGERLVVDPGGWDAVNGISCSPKRFFCIVKIWLRDDSHTDRTRFRLPPGYHGEVLYKSNSDNIRLNQQQAVRCGAGAGAGAGTKIGHSSSTAAPEQVRPTNDDPEVLTAA